jgi:starch synthase
VLSFYDPQKEALFSAADFLTRMENAALDAAQAPLHEQSAAQAAVAKAHAVVLPSEGARRQIRFSRRRLALKDALSAHPRCFGILGGVDENRFNGAMDPTLAQNYDASNLAGKQHCKRTLQESAGLAVRSDVLLAAAVLESNTAQNAESNEGLVKLAEAVLDLDIQLLFLDADDAQQRETIARLVRLQPSRIAVADPQTIGLTRLLAGVDIAIAAAEWAPWGRQALWPMALGTVPVVHDSGGLADLVVDWNFQTQTGGGFKFRPATAKNVIDAVKRAQEVFRHPETWQRLVVWNLQSVLGWKDARRRFWELYETLVNQKAQ